MSSLFSSPKVPKPPPTPTRDTSPGIMAAAAAAERQGSRAKGRKSTILGGGLGEDNVSSKTLLGQ